VSVSGDVELMWARLLYSGAHPVGALESRRWYPCEAPRGRTCGGDTRDRVRPMHSGRQASRREEQLEPRRLPRQVYAHTHPTRHPAGAGL